QEGDGDGALRSCRATLNAGRAFGEDQRTIPMLVRIAIRAIACGQIERALALTQPSDEAAGAMQPLLAEEEAAPLLPGAGRGEGAMLDAFLEGLQIGKVSLEEWKTVAKGEEAKALPAVARVERHRAGVLRFFSGLVEISKQPLEKQAQPLKALQNKTPELPLD